MSINGILQNWHKIRGTKTKRVQQSLLIARADLPRLGTFFVFLFARSLAKAGLLPLHFFPVSLLSEGVLFSVVHFGANYRILHKTRIKYGGKKTLMG